MYIFTCTLPERQTTNEHGWSLGLIVGALPWDGWGMGGTRLRCSRELYKEQNVDIRPPACADYAIPTFVHVVRLVWCAAAACKINSCKWLGAASSQGKVQVVINSSRSLHWGHAARVPFPHHGLQLEPGKVANQLKADLIACMFYLDSTA